jgi:hypothetical protein
MDPQTTGDPMSGAAAASLGIGSLLFMLILLAIFIVPLWKIFQKTGRHGAFSLLTLVPIVGPIAVGYLLAFAPWPRFER